jgi:hypothetical protein
MRARQDGLMWSEIDDKVVLLDLASAEYLSLNRSGTRLWLAVQQKRTVDELVDELVAAYGIDRPRAHDDVDRFVEHLRASNLLEE